MLKLAPPYLHIMIMAIIPQTQVTMNQTCKVCNNRDKFNFDVPDDIWQGGLPPSWARRWYLLRHWISLEAPFSSAVEHPG